MRRIKLTAPNKDTQVLKLGGPRSFCLQSCSNDHQFIFTLNSKVEETKPKLWATLNNSTGDGIKIIAGLFRGDRNQLDLGSCVFRTYLVGETLWEKTLLNTVTATKFGLDFRADLTESDLGGLQVIGERTLYIEADLLRGLKKYKASFYLNHLGIWDYALRTKNRVDFLEIEVL